MSGQFTNTDTQIFFNMSFLTGKSEKYKHAQFFIDQIGHSKKRNNETQCLEKMWGTP